MNIITNVYKCQECEAVFTNFKWRKIGFVTYGLCPECGSPNFIDVTSEYEKCECCSQYKNDCIDGVCGDCSDRLNEIYGEAVNSAQDLTQRDYETTDQFIKWYLRKVLGEKK